MNTKNNRKLNRLFQIWPRGFIFTPAHLTENGFSRENIKNYRQRGLIVNVGTGAYRLINDKVDIFSGIQTIQDQLKLPVHLGGKSVFELKGYGHYGKFGKTQYFIFLPLGLNIPKWFIGNDWGGDVVVKKTNFLSTEVEGTYSSYQRNEVTIRISSLERAMFEMLYCLPKFQGFEEAERIIEGLQTLRPEVIQVLLEACKSIKVKRLVLYFADRLNLPWFSKLDTSYVNLGSGKRVIVKNGKLDKKYNITVPSNSPE